jgi:hypothetical protein
MLSVFSSLIESIPNITIPKPDGKPYLTRYYLLLKDRMRGNAFLHHFHSSDMDDADDGEGGRVLLLHNHPFKFSVSFVLTGGYIEERRDANGLVYTRTVKPFTFNWISSKDFHRVQLLDEKNGAWTLFFTGSRKNRSWGFWNRATNEYIDYKNYEKAVA